MASSSNQQPRFDCLNAKSLVEGIGVSVSQNEPHATFFMKSKEKDEGNVAAQVADMLWAQFPSAGFLTTSVNDPESSTRTPIKRLVSLDKSILGTEVNQKSVQECSAKEVDRKKTHTPLNLVRDRAYCVDLATIFANFASNHLEATEDEEAPGSGPVVVCEIHPEMLHSLGEKGLSKKRPERSEDPENTTPNGMRAHAARPNSIMEPDVFEGELDESEIRTRLYFQTKFVFEAAGFSVERQEKTKLHGSVMSYAYVDQMLSRCEELKLGKIVWDGNSHKRIPPYLPCEMYMPAVYSFKSGLPQQRDGNVFYSTSCFEPCPFLAVASA